MHSRHVKRILRSLACTLIVFAFTSAWLARLDAARADEQDGEAPVAAAVAAPKTEAQKRRSADNAFLAATAFAVPLNGITIDGKLDDWPKDAVRYPILNNTQVYGLSRLDGADMTNNPSLVAYFMVGYDAKSNQVYLAVVVKDDEHVVGHSFNATDAVEVYLEGRNTKRAAVNTTSYTVLQYVGVAGDGGYGQGFGENPILMQGKFAPTGSKFAHKREGDTTVYEWALTPYDVYPNQNCVLAPMKRIGFDVVVVDKDKLPERTPEWVAWGPSSGGKYGNPGGIGELVLLPENAKLVAAKGVVKDEDGKPARNVMVWCESVEATRAPAAAPAPEKAESAADSRMTAGVAQTDANGRFTIALLPGSYRFVVGRYQGFASASSQLVTVKPEAENKPFEFTARKLALPEALRKSIDAYSRLKTYDDVTVLRVVDMDAEDGGANSLRLRFAWQRPDTLKWTVKIENIETTVSVENDKLKFLSGDSWTESSADKPVTPGSIAHRTGVTVPYPVSQLAASVVTGHRFALAQDVEREIRRGLDGAKVIGPGKAEGVDCTIIELTKIAPTVAPLLSGWSLALDLKLRLWISNDGIVRRSEFRNGAMGWSPDDGAFKTRTLIYSASHGDARIDAQAKTPEANQTDAKP